MRQITMEQFAQIVSLMGFQNDDIMVNRKDLATAMNVDCSDCIKSGQTFHTQANDASYVVIGCFAPIDTYVIRKVK